MGPLSDELNQGKQPSSHSHSERSGLYLISPTLDLTNVNICSILPIYYFKIVDCESRRKIQQGKMENLKTQELSDILSNGCHSVHTADFDHCSAMNRT